MAEEQPSTAPIVEKVETPKEEPKQETTSDLLSKAENVAKRIEEANKKAEEILQKTEAIYARQLLGGKSQAGQVAKTKEQLEEEEIQKKVNESLKALGFSK